MPSKRIAKLYQAVDRTKLYPINEALELAQTLVSTKFDETVEIHLRLGIDPRKGEQQIRSTVSFPHSFGKTKKIAAFVSENQKKDAQTAGADIVYTEADVAGLQKSGKIDFDMAVATPEVMPKIAPLAKILGPKGLMPSPKSETITTNLKKTLADLKKGKVAFKNDDTANVHVAIGKISLGHEKIMDNFNAFIEALKKVKPASAKGTFIRSATLTTTMGPGIKLALK